MGIILRINVYSEGHEVKNWHLCSQNFVLFVTFVVKIS